MIITWLIPLILLIGGVILVFFTRSVGSNFLFPSWHLFAGSLCVFAAVAIFIGIFIGRL